MKLSAKKKKKIMKQRFWQISENTCKSQLDGILLRTQYAAIYSDILFMINSQSNAESYKDFIKRVRDECWVSKFLNTVK